jgi:hypothetical protein
MPLHWALYQGTASAVAGRVRQNLTALQAAEKASSRVILSEAKDLLFVCLQGERADASLRSA